MRGWPVLLVCHDEATRDQVVRLLRDAGYGMLLADSGGEAIAALADLVSIALLAQPTGPGPASPADPAADAAPPEPVSLRDVVREAARRTEREEIRKMLHRTRWNRVKAAKLLNISYRSLLYKMKTSGLHRPEPLGDCPDPVWSRPWL